MRCHHCNGTGSMITPHHVYGDEVIQCPDCEGSGKVETPLTPHGETLARVQQMSTGGYGGLSGRDKDDIRILLAMTREAACPCCKEGMAITVLPSSEREPCQECKGSGLAIVAYETLRIHLKLLEQQLYDLREAVSPGRIAKPKYYIGVAARLRALDTVIKATKRSDSQ